MTQHPHAPGERSSSFTAFGMRAEATTLRPGLHVVATPIGNLGDVSFRALGTLAAAAAVLAEDTRVTKTLLAHYGITTPLTPYHEHNAEEMRPRILARLKAGESLALVSDAGTPLVSDPGFKLVQAAVAEGIPVTGVPGPSAVLAALVVAGLPTDRFFFEGFLPAKSAGRRERLEALRPVPGTLVFFESPRRVADMLADARDVLGDRDAAVARELTKYFENVRRGTLGELAERYAAEDAPKGEIVVLIGPPTQHAAETQAQGDDAIDAKLREALAKLSVKDAVAIVAQDTGMPRKRVYARAVALVKE
ncbi:ribosomal RNA small subunit methyltransferase I [Alsobacter metallidurans]|uniref:Ribosomal RNA small subunit methyltransferase I n=1 Tax=Alsobacter metallidurans TaxID=340221 RepID=A0A917I2T9_9HYPH|nr:16S rRNA (cytidine(1402)-2'-O)-methyltransferase [Alsobacter metallidurans]GGH08007.1 ribosomal RNA small subunit methyltransferase I [Alsobacter metallidurans]